MQIAIAVQHMTDIRGATRRSECDCPVARAINRRFNVDWPSLYRGVRVNSGDGVLCLPVARFNLLPEQIIVELPVEAEIFIRHYDDGEFVEPFTFVIDVPEALGLLAQPVPALPASVE